MKPTFRGKLSIGALLALGFSSIIFVDIAIFTAFIFVLFVVLSGLFWVAIIAQIPRRFFSFSKARVDDKSWSLSATVFPGEQFDEDFYLQRKGRGEITISTKIDFLRLDPSRIPAGMSETRIHARFKTPFVGEYRAKEMKISAKDPLGLFQGSCSIPVSIEFLVPPKLFDIALRTMKILGKVGIGEMPLRSAGIGTEPFEMRPFQSGDDARFVNWKASARAGELIVTEREREVGTSYYLVLDAVASNFFDRDRLATTFLQIANSLTILGARFGILVHDRDRILALRTIDEPALSLESALHAALDFVQIKEKPFRNLLDMVPSGAMKNKVEVLSQLGLTMLSRFEESGRLNVRDAVKQEPYSTMLELMDRNPNDPPVIYYISDVPDFSIHQIIETGWNLWKIFRSHFVVVSPVAPWVVAKNESEAAMLYERYAKNLAILERANIEYFVGEPLKIVQDLILD